MVEVDAFTLSIVLGGLIILVARELWRFQRPPPACAEDEDAEDAAQHAVDERADAHERSVRARLKFTVDGNVRWLRESSTSGDAASSAIALNELLSMLEHLQSLGRLGRQRLVEYCNAVVDADGLNLLHALSESKVSAVGKHAEVTEPAVRLFHALVPLIWG